MWIYAHYDGGFRKAFEVIDQYQKSDGRWVGRLNCQYWFGDWIETQDKELWEAYGERHRAIYNVREELMTLIRLKWL